MHWSQEEKAKCFRRFGTISMRERKNLPRFTRLLTPHHTPFQCELFALIYCKPSHSFSLKFRRLLLPDLHRLRKEWNIVTGENFGVNLLHGSTRSLCSAFESSWLPFRGAVVGFFSASFSLSGYVFKSSLHFNFIICSFNKLYYYISIIVYVFFIP